MNMRTKALWRKYRRKIYKVADWVLYISGGFSALLLLWIVLQVTTVAHFVVPTGEMEPLPEKDRMKNAHFIEEYGFGYDSLCQTLFREG